MVSKQKNLPFQRNGVADKFEVNKDGNVVYIKHHFLAEHRQKQFSKPEAMKLSGEDPDHFKKPSLRRYRRRKGDRVEGEFTGHVP